MRRRRLKRQRKSNVMIIILSVMVCLMSIGYAAFQTSINITAKGNIIKVQTTVDDLKQEVVTVDDGLYKDEDENNRYIYRGENPNNYIKFNDELWRIVAIESDNTLKIIREDNIEQQAFDTVGNRTDGYCSQGRAPMEGCNVYGAISGTFDNNGYSGLVSKNSYISNYLNNTFYQILNNEQVYIVSHTFKMGPIDYDQTTMGATINEENKYTWHGRIGLINVSDFMRSSLDPACTDIVSARNDDLPCRNSNYLVVEDNENIWWTMHAFTGVTHRPVYISNNGFITSTYAANDTSAYIRPVVFLTSELILEGNGTKNNPYVIVNE